MYVVKLNGMDVAGLPPARMLATIQQRPLEITFSDRCSVAMEEFNPWGDEQHDEPVRLREGALSRGRVDCHTRRRLVCRGALDEPSHLS